MRHWLALRLYPGKLYQPLQTSAIGCQLPPVTAADAADERITLVVDLCESSKHIILDCTILQLGLHILLFGLHKIGWTAPLEYALALCANS